VEYGRLLAHMRDEGLLGQQQAPRNQQDATPQGDEDQEEDGEPGQGNNPSASFDEDAAVIHYKATLGILMRDPSACISLIPNLLKA
jgi:hypothetical protein